uniref:Urotensin 1 n=1 Tax=Labrus bergylta TaxID=56723 RepID=A0A3Q3FM97_9LABR
MKPVPLLLLLSSVLLSSHLRPAAGRPRTLPGWLDELLSENLLKLLQNRSRDPLSLLNPEEEETEDDAVRAAAAQLLKRSDDPPLSIDLTFHLMRNMIEMAKMERQREQALLNRKVLDEVGK